MGWLSAWGATAGQAGWAPAHIAPQRKRAIVPMRQAAGRQVWAGPGGMGRACGPGLPARQYRSDVRWPGTDRHGCRAGLSEPAGEVEMP